MSTEFIGTNPKGITKFTRPWNPHIDAWEDPRNPLLPSKSGASALWAKVINVVKKLRAGIKPQETPEPDPLAIALTTDGKLSRSTDIRGAFLAFNRTLSFLGLVEKVDVAFCIFTVKANDPNLYIGAITQPPDTREKIIDEIAILNKYLRFEDVYLDQATFDMLEVDGFLTAYMGKQGYDLSFNIIERDKDITVRTKQLSDMADRNELQFSPKLDGDPLKAEVSKVGSIVADSVAGAQSASYGLR